jgi:beta-glucanase (GH16 family)
MIKLKSIKYTSSLIFVFILLCCYSGCEQGYKLVWSDEFSDDKLDMSKWEYMIGDGTKYNLPSGWGNNESQFYRAENAIIENDNLVIIAKKENYLNKKYTSARIRSLNKGDWKYGRIEFRAKFPSGQGIWSAIWMLPSDNLYGGWAASGEIDIVEHLGHENKIVHGTLHYGGTWPENTSTAAAFTRSKNSFSDDFHLFAMEWEEGIIKWFVDDSLYQTQTSWYSGNAKFPAPFDQRFHLLINVAVGGNWPGPADGTTLFPQKLEVDYIRVYQKN